VSRNVFLSLFFQDWASTEKEFSEEPEKAADCRETEKEEDKTPSVGADPNTTVALPVIDQVIFFVGQCRGS
jgi:hypothetical protein